MLWLLIVVALIGLGALAWFWRQHDRADRVAQGSAEPRDERQDEP